MKDCKHERLRPAPADYDRECWFCGELPEDIIKSLQAEVSRLTRINAELLAGYGECLAELRFRGTGENLIAIVVDLESNLRRLSTQQGTNDD